MGGDHKCPVCQATFTRPQHVARHMRSHTGDRPYKCQHCGDQFARSDLLSRHVNKCHAGEKALIGSGVSGGGPGSGGGRRKGSTATRATTSKQACDQCVQSSLPCDGCNPCSKCVQRKCRCTYVKFHRQTAPIGPGHNPRPIGASGSGLSMTTTTGLPGGSLLANPSASTATNVALYASSLHQHHAHAGLHPSQHGPHHPHPHSHPHLQPQVAQAYNSLYPNDDFLLGPAPGSGIPHISSGSSSTGGAPSTTTSNSAAGSGAAAAGFGAGSFTFPPVYAQGGGSHSDGEGVGGDYTTRYRELMRRGSVPSTATYPAAPGGGDVDLLFGPGGAGYYGSSGGAGYYRNQDFRRGGGGGGQHHESESESESASGSASATSSSVHLPLGVGVDGFVSNGSQQYLLNAHHHGGHDSSASPPNLQSHMHPPPPSSTATGPTGAPGPPGGHTELSRPGTAHGVSSVFGLMSLDDPNVLAGLATDGQPFFHDAFGDVAGVDIGGGAGAVVDGSDPNATPMPRFTNTSPHQGTSVLPPIGVIGGQQQSSSSASPPSSVHHGQHLQRPSTSGGRHPQDPQQLQQQQQAQPFPVTPGLNREQETRELREFWKQYMRTPLSGGGGGGLLGVPNPPNSSSSTQDVNMMSPGIPGYRRGRVSSLPSVKTPTDEVYPPVPFSQQVRYSKSNHHLHQQHHHQSQQPHHHGPTAQTATGMDDLKSYEAAVLARKAPTNLNLAPKVRKRGTVPGAGSAKGVSFAPTPTGVLAGGGGQGGMNGVTSAGVSNASGSGGGTSPSRRRPSFKRLASQTLESGVAKRALLMNSSEDGDGDDEGDEWEGELDDDTGFTPSGGVHMSPQPLVGGGGGSTNLRNGTGSDGGGGGGGVSSTSASPVVPPSTISAISAIQPVLSTGGVGSGSPLMFAKGSPVAGMVSTDG